MTRLIEVRERKLREARRDDKRGLHGTQMDLNLEWK